MNWVSIGAQAMRQAQIVGPSTLCQGEKKRSVVVSLTGEFSAALAAIKAWPGNRGGCCRGGATASLDGGCAPRSADRQVGTKEWSATVEQRNGPSGCDRRLR